MFGSPQGLEPLDVSSVRKKRQEVKKLILTLAGRPDSWHKKNQFSGCKCFWTWRTCSEWQKTGLGTGTERNLSRICTELFCCPVTMGLNYETELEWALAQACWSVIKSRLMVNKTSTQADISLKPASFFFKAHKCKMNEWVGVKLSN